MALTTLDKFMQMLELFGNAWLAQSNLRENIQVLQKGAADGTLKVPIDEAVRNMAKAFQARLDVYDAKADANLLLQASAAGIDPADFVSLNALLRAKVENLAVTTITTKAELDVIVADVLATIPKTERAFIEEARP